MPDIWTHIICGEEVLNSLHDSKWKEILIKNKKLFNLGCQGPDIFLYNDFWPWIKEKRGVKFGSLLHEEKTGEFFIKGFNYLKHNIEKQKGFQLLFTYLAGFVCHFGLDRVAHPYIHYYSGKYDKNKPETRKYSGYHKKLEVIIDSIIVKERKGIDAYKYPVFKEIDIEGGLPKVVVQFYKYIISNLYKYKSNPDFIVDSYNDMKKVFKITHDRLGIKKVLLYFIDLVTRGDIDYNSVIYPRRLAQRDYMNRNHNIWNHPCDKKEVYNSSFDDLLDKAVIESREMLKGAIMYLEDKLEIKDLEKLFPNISYVTGKPTNQKCEIIYYDPIFER
ncbi:zinc dependent phospholipase C family protein [Caldisalinibacter kiritimatiensis]|uniref:Phospholipase C/D domain-containing protein n=1 Tax=Caldisalinibacter kiritimatiensis TaxID=1304284 RepID=R1CDE8_9FIRM|nr:zinc dependent phospholipase C family protein [Caldisalinibacter kiritimatiensis]EOD00315.1 hypothetical protein L21TH_1614 [Caldisalinibacter kiritimatiensis]